MIEVVDSGLVYRNPKPWLRSRQTWHPTLVRFDDGEWLCTFDIAEADVAHDYRTYGARSADDGRTWQKVTLVKCADGYWRGSFRTAHKPGGFVSLRASARTDAGYSVKHEIIRAYGLR